MTAADPRPLYVAASFGRYTRSAPLPLPDAIRRGGEIARATSLDADIIDAEGAVVGHVDAADTFRRRA